MHIAFLPLVDGAPIPLRVKQWNQKTFIECSSSFALLSFLGASSLEPQALADTFVRGVCTPGEGGLFEIFDRFGSTGRSPIRLSEEVVRDRILNAMIWEVRNN